MSCLCFHNENLTEEELSHPSLFLSFPSSSYVHSYIDFKELRNIITTSSRIYPSYSKPPNRVVPRLTWNHTFLFLFLIFLFFYCMRARSPLILHTSTNLGCSVYKMGGVKNRFSFRNFRPDKYTPSLSELRGESRGRRER